MMSNKERNLIVATGIAVVIFLILYNHLTSDHGTQRKVKTQVPFFPTQTAVMTKPYKKKALKGILELKENCIKVSGFLVVWPKGYTINRNNRTFQLVNSQGRLLAQTGDSVKVIGLQDSSKNYSDLYKNSGCSGPYWVAAEILKEQ